MPNRGGDDAMPMMDNPMPPMGGQDPMGDMGGQMDMNQEEPMGDDPMGGDAQGEDADGPGGDVRKYAGELSQALNDYNEENPSDEGKLNKYAINMIAAQVADSLSDKDKRGVIKKLNGNADDMSDDSMPQDDVMNNGGNQMGLGESIVSEIVGELDKERRVKRNEKRITNKGVTRRNPFVGNRK